MLRLFVALRLRKKEVYMSSVDSLLTYPLAEILDDFQKTLLSLLKVQLGVETGEAWEKVASLYGKDLIKLVRVCSAEWVLDSFKNDISLQTALLAIYQMFTPVENVVAVDRSKKV